MESLLPPFVLVRFVPLQHAWGDVGVGGGANMSCCSVDRGGSVGLVYWNFGENVTFVGVISNVFLSLSLDFAVITSITVWSRWLSSYARTAH